MRPKLRVTFLTNYFSRDVLVVYNYIHLYCEQRLLNVVGANRCRGNEQSRTCVGQMSMSGRLRALEHVGCVRESQLPD